MMKRGLGVIGSIALCGTLAAAMQTEGAKAQGIPSHATALYAKIQASLALIEARDGKAFAFGTAFCIGRWLS